jgi:Fe-S oxidoreductase
MKKVFAPGCALLIYKPQLATKMLEFLKADLGDVEEHLTCCRHEPKLRAGTQVINTCAGCDKRYGELYEGITTVSLWEVLVESESFPFPDYRGQTMTILDACPTRDQDRIHTAIRFLLARMNIRVVEPAKTKTRGTCCGDSFYGVLELEQVKEQMTRRAAEMPADNVVVYCVSCCKAMQIGGKQPRYMVDLLLGEDTKRGISDLDEWHDQLDRFIETH